MLANMIDPKGNEKKVFDIPTGTMLGKNKVTRKETCIYIYRYMYSPTSNGKIYMKINFMSWYQIRIQKNTNSKHNSPKNVEKVLSLLTATYSSRGPGHVKGRFWSRIWVVVWHPGKGVPIRKVYIMFGSLGSFFNTLRSKYINGTNSNKSVS